MGWRWVPMVGLLLLAGCGQAEPTGPKVGDKVILPAAENLYRDVSLMRKYPRPPVRRGVPGSELPKQSIVDDNVVMVVRPGSLLEVIEVFPDAAAVLVTKDDDGQVVDRHGYLPRWW